MKRTKKPPLGCIPKYIHREARIVELKSAISRYTFDHWPIPMEIVEEYNELVKDLEVEEESV